MFQWLFSWPSNNECYFGGNQDKMLKMVETRTIQSHLTFDVLPLSVADFLQFNMCMRFPRHLNNDMVSLSTVTLVHSLNVNQRKWQLVKIC